MYCRKCGANNADDAATCHACGDALRPVAAAAAPPPAKISNYLVLSIIVTVFCCMPLGIPAIVHAAQVNARAQLGDIAGAQIYSRKARMWAFWGLGIGLLIYGAYAVMIVVAIMTDPNFQR